MRTLSALDVPTRYTYITFDPLMTFDELKAAYAFQGRIDLLLRPQPGLGAREIVRGVLDEEWVAAHTTGRALHTGISYLLVSLECLIGAAYTRQAAAAGLTGQPEPLMGCVARRYRGRRIGVVSGWAQRWVDRHFALDYTVKSAALTTAWACRWAGPPPMPVLPLMTRPLVLQLADRVAAPHAVVAIMGAGPPRTRSPV
ncbi:hypothetical protein ACPF8X_00945 [Streptomyces sp. G35A]